MKNKDKIFFKRRYFTRSIVFILLIGLITGKMTIYSEAAGYIKTGNDELVLVIDPGHGGEQEGAQFEYDGILIDEKDLDLSIALFLRDELNKYENVRIVMTRETDITLGLEERADMALAEAADYYISIHCNAEGDDEQSVKNPTGAMMIVPYGNYQPAFSVSPEAKKASILLGRAVLEKLIGIGLKTATDFGEMNVNGIIQRPYSEAGWASTTKYYPDESVTDYYGQMRFNMENGIPAILIEHAYMSDEKEYRKYLAGENERSMLAKADAEGIANALHLIKKEEY